MPSIPQDSAIDSTLGLFGDGYAFIRNRCHSHGSDIFQTRLLMQKTICMLGEDAARIFYDNDKFVRHGAMPGRVQNTLLGKGGVQSLDDARHVHRKHMFVELLMTPERIAELAAVIEHHWKAAFARWQGRQRVVLFDEAQDVFCRAVCEWAGVPLAESESGLRTRQLAAMIDSAGKLGPGYWRGRLARMRCERWISGLIEAVRSHVLQPGADTALHVVAMHTDLHGKLLPARIAAVELINVLRPTVAIARFVTFGALAMHEHPHCRQNIATGDAGYIERFVQEVRRYYPFFPFLAARVRADFVWKGYLFPQGRKVMLDLYGTNHDERLWHVPDEFRPERFDTQEINAYNLIPNGGGDYRRNHRCPGEWITVELMQHSLGLLARAIRYEVPPQDLTVSLTRMPALPASGFVIRNVMLRE